MISRGVRDLERGSHKGVTKNVATIREKTPKIIKKNKSLVCFRTHIVKFRNQALVSGTSLSLGNGATESDIKGDTEKTVNPCRRV